MRYSFLILLGMAAFSCLPAYAQSIESEPLPPPAWQKQEETPPAIKTTPPTPIPLTTRTGAPASTQTPPPSTMSDDDSGMSGTSGASSAYDLGKPAAQPADIKPEAVQDAPATNTAEPDPYVQPRSETIRIGVAPKDDPRLETKKFCTMKISFGSIGTGVDGKTGASIKSYLDANTGKLTYVRNNWGREGEYDYCLDIPEHKNRATIYRELKRLLPAMGTNKAYTTLSGPGFTPVTTAR